LKTYKTVLSPYTTSIGLSQDDLSLCIYSKRGTSEEGKREKHEGFLVCTRPWPPNSEWSLSKATRYFPGKSHPTLILQGVTNGGLLDRDHSNPMTSLCFPNQPYHKIFLGWWILLLRTFYDK
jgi:hypothetical protein